MAGNGNGKGRTLKRRGRRNLRRSVPNGNGEGNGVPFWLKGLVGLSIFGLTALFVLFIVAVGVYRSYADDLLAPDELAINKPSYGARILDRNGRLLYEYVDDHAGLRRPVKLENVSPAFLAATISTEDDSFFTNPGVNIKGLARAGWENFSPFDDTPGVLGGSGGSSITQQLVKNVYIPEKERQQRSISRKLKETVYAIELTQRYSKERILEWYVNQISYGGVYNGIEAAAQGYFGKAAKDLTIGEAALLAGIPQSPAAYDPVNNLEAAAERRNQIIDLMERKESIQIGKDTYWEVPFEELEAARQEPIQIAEKRFPIEAPHFVLQYVQPQLEQLFGHDALFRDGLVVTTSLNLDLQHEAGLIMERWIREFENISASRNGSMMVMDPRSGEVLVMIGSRDYFREDIQGKNNNATACNSPGSSFKPFAYITAFLELGWGPGTIVLDTPVEYKEANGKTFVPTNPGKNFLGPITVRSALGNSLNVPANKTAAAVGPDKIVSTARKLGFLNTFRLSSDPGGCSAGSFGPAIATGGIGVTLEDMMFGYSVLANGGLMKGQETIVPQSRRANERKLDPVSILKVTDAENRVRFDVETKRKEERIVKEEYTYLISNILSDSSAQAITFGAGGISVPGRTVAVKTGTSEPFDPEGPNRGKIGETWAFGYTPDYVVGIWAGNSDNAPIVNIFSTSISFRAMRDVMLATYADRPTTPFRRPEGLVEETLCMPSHLKPTSLCGKQSKDLWVKEKLPTKDDDWWQIVQIDRRTGLPAAPGTPFAFIEQRLSIVFPPELLRTEDQRKQAAEWGSALGAQAAQAGAALPGGGGPLTDVPVTIFTPTAGADVAGVVQISGRASTRDFQFYRLEFGVGPNPSVWSQITRLSTPVESGTLGVWNVNPLGPGVYTLRLVVSDRLRGEIAATVIVNIGKATSTPAVSGTPVLAP